MLARLLPLQVEVWDHDKYKRSDFIGEVSVDLGQQFSGIWAAGVIGPLQFDLYDAHNRLGEQERLRKQVGLLLLFCAWLLARSFLARH